MQQYFVNLMDGTQVSVLGYSILDAENHAIEIYGNNFVSIGSKP